MQIHQQATGTRASRISGRRRWFVFAPRAERSPAPVWTSEAEVLRALGECRPSPRGSPSTRPDMPLQRPWF